MDEKRRFSRLTFDADTSLTVSGEEVKCHVIDISIKGALLTIPAHLALSRGQNARLTLKLNDSDVVITMDVTTAHVTGDKAGFYCREIDSDSVTHLRRLVELNLGDPELLERELTQLGTHGGEPLSQ